jgi:hypothetical protein
MRLLSNGSRRRSPRSGTGNCGACAVGWTATCSSIPTTSADPRGCPGGARQTSVSNLPRHAAVQTPRTVGARALWGMGWAVEVRARRTARGRPPRAARGAARVHGVIRRAARRRGWCGTTYQLRASRASIQRRGTRYMALAFREWIHVSPLQGYQDSLLSFHARKTRRTAMTETYEVARGSDGLHRWRRPPRRGSCSSPPPVPPALTEV